MDTEQIERELLNHPSRNGLPAAECRTIARSIGSKPPGRSAGLREGGWLSPVHEFADRRGWPVAELDDRTTTCVPCLRCGTTIATIGPGAGPHHAELRCQRGHFPRWRPKPGGAA